MDHHHIPTTHRAPYAARAARVVRAARAAWRTLALLALLAACLPHGARAQGFTAALSGGADTVGQGTVLQLTYRFDDLPPQRFALPELTGLRVIGGPNQMSQLSIVNGVRTSSASLTYNLIADAVGPAAVPEVSVEFNGEVYTCEPLGLFVTDDPGYVPMPPEGVLRQRDTLLPRRRRPTVRM